MLRHVFTLVWLLAPLSLLAQETIHSNWTVVTIGTAVKPSFDFDAEGGIHIMGMTENPGGGPNWHAYADRMSGPWEPREVIACYFYGPGDLRVDTNGMAHMAFHHHHLENGVHVIIQTTD